MAYNPHDDLYDGPNGSPTAEVPDVNAAMEDTLRSLKVNFEPFAVEVYGNEMPVASIAISLKRIADNTDVMRMAAAALNDNSYKSVDALVKISTELKLMESQQREMKSALFSVETAVRNNTGREITLNLKDARD